MTDAGQRTKRWPTMHAILVYIFKGLATLGAALCFSLAWLVYPDENGQIQSKLEDWWVSLQDAQRAVFSRMTIFVHGISILATNAFNRVFGKRLVSLQAIAVSAWLSLSSVGLAVGLLNEKAFPLWLDLTPMATQKPMTNAFLQFVICFGLALICQISFWLRLVLFIYLLYTILKAAFFVAVVFLNSFLPDIPTALFLSPLTVGVIANCLFVLAMRQLLRWCQRIENTVASVSVLTGTFLAGVLLLVVPWILAGSEYFNFGIDTRLVLLAGAISNLFDAVLSIGLFGLVLLLVLTRFLWPVANRALYAVSDAGVRKAILVGLGSVLTTVAAGKSISAVVQKVLH
jgi:hypothetical protein